MKQQYNIYTDQLALMSGCGDTCNKNWVWNTDNDMEDKKRKKDVNVPPTTQGGKRETDDVGLIPAFSCFFKKYCDLKGYKNN